MGGGCNQETGQCECLPGVVGQNCDHCPPNWILIMNETRTYVPEWKRPFDYEEGCFPCASCVADLMATSAELREELAPSMSDFRAKNNSYFTYRRLGYINDEIERLRPEIALLNPEEGNKRIEPLEGSMNNLHITAKSLNVEYKRTLMEELSNQAKAVEKDGLNAVAEMGSVGVEVMSTIKGKKVQRCDISRHVDIRNVS